MQIHINGGDNDNHFHINSDEPSSDEPDGGGKALYWAKVAYYATTSLLALLSLLL